MSAHSRRYALTCEHARTHTHTLALLPYRRPRGCHYTRPTIHRLLQEIASTVSLLRQATVRVVEAIVAWRGGLTSQAPFRAALDADGAGGVGGSTPNYMRHMATDLDGMTDLSAEMPAVLHEVPSRLDRRRLWRVRQAIDLEPQTEQRAALAAAGGAAVLRWQPVSSLELFKVAENKGTPCLFTVTADDDAELLAALHMAAIACADAPGGQERSEH